MAQHGGKRPGAGRKPGRVSKAKRDLADMAKDHVEQALKVLVSIATGGASEAARVSAANAILDRAYGKPAAAQEAPPADTPQPYNGWHIERTQPLEDEPD